MSKQIVPITLLTGFLGSGKTTLVNHILYNKKGMKVAVIVNDIGEVNIDATLIQKGGVVSQQDDSLVALSNGCICCSLQTDLIKQITDITETGNFDYIVIEASGICEPYPIANTIVSISEMAHKFGLPEICRLDCVVTVVDALRISKEFSNGSDLAIKNSEEDLANLVIQQIEFCDVIVLNKVSEVSFEELQQVKAIVKLLQPHAEIIETDFAKVDLEKIINCGRFDMEKISVSAGWVSAMDEEAEQRDAEPAAHHHKHECHCHEHHDDECHCHEHGDHECHCHEHHDGECHCHEHEEQECHCHHDHGHEEGHKWCCHHHGEDGEHGISSFVYYRRKPMSLNAFDHFVYKQWPKSVIRAKGIVYFSDNEIMSYLFEQAGTQKTLQEAGQWICTAPEEEIEMMKRQSPELRRDWDEKYGDKMVKIVFIGKQMDKEAICKALDQV